jgi:hypothetical protein
MNKTLKSLIKKYEDMREGAYHYGCDHSKIKLIDEIICDLKNCKESIEQTKLLFVEEGSINVESEKESIQNLGYKIIVCKQGVKFPMVLESAKKEVNK